VDAVIGDERSQKEVLLNTSLSKERDEILAIVGHNLSNPE
jgi:ABC-type polysaccharide/polyol phosphate transport system ATPase subunit